MNEELKPCPFCGGEAELVTGAHRDGGYIENCAFVRCKGCGVRSYEFHECVTPDEVQGYASETWNRRAERTCRWVWTESWSDTELGRECDYANWTLDCGCWDGWDRELHDFDDPCEPPREWDYCPHCGAKVVG